MVFCSRWHQERSSSKSLVRNWPAEASPNVSFPSVDTRTRQSDFHPPLPVMASTGMFDCSAFVGASPFQCMKMKPGSRPVSLIRSRLEERGVIVVAFIRQWAPFGNRCPHHAAFWICRQYVHPQAHRGRVRLGQDGGGLAQGAASRTAQDQLAVHLRHGCLQPHTPAEIARRDSMTTPDRPRSIIGHRRNVHQTTEANTVNQIRPSQITTRGNSRCFSAAC